MIQTVKARRVRFDRWGYIFVMPFFLAFLAFQFYPIANTLYLAFTNMKGSSLDYKVVGFSNFARSSQQLKLTGLSADQANSLIAGLQAAGISADTDAPATDTSGGAYDLGSDTTTADASAATGYSVQVNQLSAADTDAVRKVLTGAGIPSDAVDKAITTTYAGLVFDSVFWQSFVNTALIFALNFVPQLFFALVFSVWLTDLSLKIRFGGFFKTILYLPNIITATSVAVLFASLFGYPSGPVNQFTVQNFGLHEAVNFFRSEIWTRGIVAFIQFWMWYGTTIIVLSAGILGISPSLFESAVVDGATPGQMFWRITLPLLRPIMSFTLVTSLIGGLQMFDIPFLITNRRGDPNGSILTTSIYLYNQAFSSVNNYSYAAAISAGMFILILILAGILFSMMQDPDDAKEKGGRR